MRPTIVIAGAGLHGASLAYYLSLRGETPLIIEASAVASAASGKGGGFLARDWGSGVTEQLHKVSFSLHEELAQELRVSSYRKIPVLLVTPGKRTARTKQLCPWLDGEYAHCEPMDLDGGAQVAPHELCTKLVDAAVANGAQLRIGKVQGIKCVDSAGGERKKLSAVVVDGEEVAARALAVTMGPWATCAAEWFGMPIPMTGIKSTSVVFRGGEDDDIEPYALFCGEDDRFGTHLEVYPRSSGEVYLCGVGGSEYVTAEQLVAGKYPPGEVFADPARVKAAADSFSLMSKRLGKCTPDASQACMRPCPPDALPLMGKVPTVEGAYISAGHNCWGILWSPVSGKAMSELILDGAASCVDLRPFAPGRFMRTSKGRGRKRGEAPVGEQW